MTDPHSVVSGVIIGTAAAAPSVLMGVHTDALILGLMAAVFVSIWLDTINSRLKAASAVLFSALLAGYGSPVAAEWVAGSAVVSNTESLRLLLAVTIGALTPALFPVIVKVLKTKANGVSA